jgi:hypothetical protein
MSPLSLRSLTIETAPDRKVALKVEITVEPEGDDVRCRYCIIIEGHPDDGLAGSAMGVDAWQAIEEATRLIDSDIDAFYRSWGEIEWPGGGRYP